MPEDRIVVAMSGGVDSSVAAAFLKEKGYDVVGVTIRFWGRDGTDDVEDARRVARRLDIPHEVVSFDASFKHNVVDYFVSEYLKGRTPNPCAVCNPMIKFGELLRKADEAGARFMATGHYAVVSHDAKRSRYLLRWGKERGKDQSYFLARLSQASLSRALFPVGSFPKAKIRALAERLGLAVADKRESQEVCFIPDGRVAAFVEEQAGRAMERGAIVDTEGRTLGAHRGIAGYTIGQRKGLGIAVGSPVYVTRLDAETNTVVVGSADALYRRRFRATDPNWIAVPELTASVRLQARIRYKHRPAWAWVAPWGDRGVEVRFERPQRAITPGQLAVFYEDDVVVGSAWIDEVLD